MPHGSVIDPAIRQGPADIGLDNDADVGRSQAFVQCWVDSTIWVTPTGLPST
ncbi:hypothetical protein N8D56_03560 [Devosia sp. A8/3-2]|nr:hypothetical protein N8D56_03560 [Devosia sp. A8/3-2]